MLYEALLCSVPGDARRSAVRGACIGDLLTVAINTDEPFGRYVAVIIVAGAGFVNRRNLD
jgi:hypothetical protein